MSNLTERSKHKFFVAIYYIPSEGIIYNIQISSVYENSFGIDYEYEKFCEFIGNELYYSQIEELNEREFFIKYQDYIPAYVLRHFQSSTKADFLFQTHIKVKNK